MLNCRTCARLAAIKGGSALPPRLNVRSARARVVTQAKKDDLEDAYQAQLAKLEERRRRFLAGELSVRGGNAPKKQKDLPAPEAEAKPASPSIKIATPNPASKVVKVPPPASPEAKVTPAAESRSPLDFLNNIFKKK